VHVLVGAGAEGIGPCLDTAGSWWQWTCGDQLAVAGCDGFIHAPPKQQAGAHH
jgi:hypothetical protein